MKIIVFIALLCGLVVAQQQIVQPPIPLQARTCISTGDPHITSFTGLHFDFQGVGDFPLTWFAGTLIQSRQQSCGLGVTCNIGVGIGTSDGNVLQIVGDSVTFNGVALVVPIGPPDVFSSLLSVQHFGTESYQVYITGGIVEWYYGTITIYITNPSIPTPYWGICSNNSRCFNPPIPGNPNPIKDPPIQQVANTWIVQSVQESTFIYTDPSTFTTINQPDAYQNLGPFVSTDQDIINLYTSACAPLAQSSTVQQCQQFVSPAPHYNDCVNDVIASSSSEYAIGPIRAYSILCANYVRASG